MSRLEELIAELCPDGVEYKTLGEIAVYISRLWHKARSSYRNRYPMCSLWRNLYYLWNVV